MKNRLVVCLILALVAGCEALPHDGPSIDAVRRDASGAKGGYSLVELDARTGEIVESLPRRDLDSLGAVSSSARVDLIGVGDGLSVTVYERGAGALFSTGVTTTGEGRPAAGAIPVLIVDSVGEVTMPFGGKVSVAGLTTPEAAQALQHSLKGKAVDPQVVVNIAENVSNSVTMMGEVRNPGRYPLGDGSDRLLDVLALAAGPTKPPADIRVVVTRGAKMASVPLDKLLQDTGENVRLAPRDQIRLIYQPRKFDTFGALGRSSQIPIEDETLTLADALSRAGGLDINSADASSVLVFRFERPEVASALSVGAPPTPKGVPIVYHLNLRSPGGLFTANRFEVEPDDLIYVPRSGYVETKQFIDLVNAATAIAYNVRVTSVVP